MYHDIRIPLPWHGYQSVIKLRFDVFIYNFYAYLINLYILFGQYPEVFLRSIRRTYINSLMYLATCNVMGWV